MSPEAGPEPSGGDRRGAGGLLARRAGFGFLGLSAALWAAVFVVPFLPLTTPWKVGLATGAAIVGEAAFWVAAVLLGREVVRRYRGYLDPRRLFGGRG